VPDPFRSAALHVRTARRVVRGRTVSVGSAFGPLEGRMVFVVGSPRSGTTFLARAIGSSPGFVDLGEVAALKAEIPRLAELEPAAAAPRVRRILAVTRRLALVGRLRAVEQTPETAFVAAAVRLALPESRIVHIVRDGRDVACSLVERGWLSAGRRGGDDAGLPYGAKPRFWVEPERREEFLEASDVRRAAWAWRRYVEAARSVGEGEFAHTIRYERLSADREGTAGDLAVFLDTPAEPLVAALSSFFDSSIGRFRRDLTGEQLEEIEREAGPLLHDLGYLQ
jgi:hypothetical protein